MNWRVVHQVDEEWPHHLGAPALLPMPKKLFVRGDRIPPKDQCIAIVGTRRPTATGLEIASMFARAFAESGFTVVSGMALGIDSEAHRAALAAGGRTIAVLGSGIDVCYPKKNRRLFEAIPGRGSLVTEYEPGVEPQKAYFPARNRIIAGLSRSTIVVEGGLKSGAMITAGFALEANRSVFAIPGSLFNPVAAGPNELIRIGEAYVATDPQHVFDDLAPHLVWSDPYKPGDTTPALSTDEATVLSSLESMPVTMDRVVAVTDLAPGQVSLCLAKLQLRGLAKRSRSGGFEITPSGSRKLSSQQSW